MKKIFCLILIIFLQFSLVSCANNESNDEISLKSYFANYNCIDDISIHKAETKNYFAEKQYVSFAISNEFVVNFDEENIILFDDKTAMAKLYSYINISLADKNYFKNHTGVYVNPSTNQIISKISTGDQTLKLTETNLENFKIVNAIQISPIFETYSNIGIAVYLPYNQEDEIEYSTLKLQNTSDSISSPTGETFFSFLKDDFDYENLSISDFNHDINFDFSKETSESNIKNITLYFDLLNDSKFIVLTILKTEDENFEYLIMTNENSNYYTINNCNNSNLINFIFTRKTQNLY